MLFSRRGLVNTAVSPAGVGSAGQRPCPARIELVERDDQLGDDQDHDRRLQPRGAVGVDDVGQRMRGLDDHRELALQGLAALLQLVFVLEARIEALEVGPVPQYVGLFLDGDAARNAVLGEQRLADQAQHRASAERRAPAPRQGGGERLDHVEHRVDFALVARQRHRLGQRVGERRGSAAAKGPSSGSGRPAARLVAIRALFRGPPSRRRPAPARRSALLELGERILLLQRRQADHHRDAEAKQRDHAARPDPEGAAAARKSCRGAPAPRCRCARRRSARAPSGASERRAAENVRSSGQITPRDGHAPARPMPR